MRILSLLIFIFMTVASYSQRNIIYSPYVASLQVVGGVRWQEMPIVKLNGNEAINISFDDLTHTYHRYTYKITHLEADFSESDGLFTSDYIVGFTDGLTIDDDEQSINTIQNYTHYSLTIPNANCRLKLSGNYRIDVYDDRGEDYSKQNNLGEDYSKQSNPDGDYGNLNNHNNNYGNSNLDEVPAFSAYFMITEDKLRGSLGYTFDTDIDVRKSHQQVELSVDYTPLRPTDPRQQIKGYVLQNNRWDNAVTLPEAPRINQQNLEWDHCRQLIFPAGNEYHKFEILDIHRNSLNVENNVWDAENEEWHTMLWPDYRRGSYVYDEAAKGAFYIRNSDNIENDITSEYVNVHFFLKSEPLPHPLYVNAMWTNDRFLPQYEMQYDEAQKMYEAIIPLKYGYYSYQYLMLDGDTPLIPPTEGSFYETRNTYTALIYYRGQGERTDRLVAVLNCKTNL